MLCSPLHSCRLKRLTHGTSQSERASLHDTRHEQSACRFRSEDSLLGHILSSCSQMTPLQPSSKHGSRPTGSSKLGGEAFGLDVHGAAYVLLLLLHDAQTCAVLTCNLYVWAQHGIAHTIVCSARGVYSLEFRLKYKAATG